MRDVDLLNMLPGHVYWYDAEGTVLGCNIACAQNFGFDTVKDMMGSNASEIILHCSTASMHELFRLTNEKVLKGETVIIEEEITLRGERVVFLSTKSPLKDEDGNIYGVAGYSLDITHLKKQEQISV